MLDIHLKDPKEPKPAVVRSNIPLYYPMGEEIFTEEKARYALEQFKPYKSPSSDGVYPIMLQAGWETLEPIYLKMSKASLKLGHIPKSGKRQGESSSPNQERIAITQQNLSVS